METGNRRDKAKGALAGRSRREIPDLGESRRAARGGGIRERPGPYFRSEGDRAKDLGFGRVEGARGAPDSDAAERLEGAGVASERERARVDWTTGAIRGASFVEIKEWSPRASGWFGLLGEVFGLFGLSPDWCYVSILARKEFRRRHV